MVCLEEVQLGFCCGGFGLFCAGVAEWLGSGLQIEDVGGDPCMLVRIRSPAPSYVFEVS